MAGLAVSDVVALSPNCFKQATAPNEGRRSNHKSAFHLPKNIYQDRSQNESNTGDG